MPIEGIDQDAIDLLKQKIDENLNNVDDATREAVKIILDDVANETSVPYVETPT